MVHIYQYNLIHLGWNCTFRPHSLPFSSKVITAWYRNLYLLIIYWLTCSYKMIWSVLSLIEINPYFNISCIRAVSAVNKFTATLCSDSRWNCRCHYTMHVVECARLLYGHMSVLQVQNLCTNTKYIFIPDLQFVLKYCRWAEEMHPIDFKSKSQNCPKVAYLGMVSKWSGRTGLAAPCC